MLSIEISYKNNHYSDRVVEYAARNGDGVLVESGLRQVRLELAGRVALEEVEADTVRLVVALVGADDRRHHRNAVRRRPGDRRAQQTQSALLLPI